MAETTTYVSWRLSFPGSGVYTANDPASLLRKLSKRQFDPDDRRWIKGALAWRAWVLTGQSIDPNLADEDFLVAFSRTGVARLEAYGEERDEWLTF